MFGRGTAAPPPSSADSQLFKYKALTPAGERKSDTMAAPNARAVVKALEREGWTPIEIVETSASAMDLDLTAWLTGGGVKLKWKARAEFSRRLHQMLRAGISLPKSLHSLAEDAPVDVAAMCTAMAEKVMGGESLAVAMREYPRAFDAVTISYIEAGETSGTLVETTGRLATMLGNRAAVQAKIKGVTAYPKMVGGAIGLLVVAIIMFLVPMYEDIYASFGSGLPGPTQALVWVSDHFMPISFSSFEVFGMKAAYPRPEPLHAMSWGIYIAIGWFIFRRKTKDNPEVNEKLDRIKFRMPIMGKLIALQAMQRWAITLAGGLASGVPITRCVALAADASGSAWHQNIVAPLVERVRTGRTLSSELANHKDLYPPSVRTMLATGEDTGELDTMLTSVAESLESDIDAQVAGLSAKIEVGLLLVLGVVVGGLLIVLYLPILNLASAASDGMAGGEGM